MELAGGQERPDVQFQPRSQDISPLQPKVTVESVAASQLSSFQQ